MVDGDECFGACDNKKQVIQLKEEIPASKRGEVILHESIHAIDAILDLSLGEKRINLLGVALYQFLTDNKLDFLEKVYKKRGKGVN